MLTRTHGVGRCVCMGGQVCGRGYLSTGLRRALERAKTIHRLTESVDHAAEERVADRHLDNRAGTRYLVALNNLTVITW